MHSANALLVNGRVHMQVRLNRRVRQQLVGTAVSDMYGHRMLFEKYGQGADVVGVLVRDENGTNAIRINTDLGERIAKPLCVFARIDQERAARGGNYKRISR